MFLDQLPGRVTGGGSRFSGFIGLCICVVPYLNKIYLCDGFYVKHRRISAYAANLQGVIFYTLFYLIGYLVLGCGTRSIVLY